MAFDQRDLTDIHSFTTDELVFILDQAEIIKKALAQKDVSKYRLAENKDLLAALLFYENSTRTRTSFEIAAMRLGMNTTGFSGTEGTSVKKGESLRHTLDMYEAYLCDALIMRHPLDGSARMAAEHLGIPVFNAGDGKHEHPTQTLLDLFTIREHLGRLKDFDIGIAGDLKYGRTAHSLAIALAKFDGIRLHLFSYKTLALPEYLMSQILEKGINVTVYDDLSEMATKTDILYQTRIQKERMPDLREYDKAKAMSEFTLEMLDKTKDSFGLMHPLPIDKGAPSISSSVDGNPKALYKIQAGNGVPTRLTELALALGLLGKDFNGETFNPVTAGESFFEELSVEDKPIRTDVSIRPLRNNGVVVDHMKPYTEDILVNLLRVKERRDIYRAATVKSLRRPDQIKGMLMIEDRDLEESDIKAIAALSPGCTVNFIREAKVVRKLRLKMPERITGIPGLICANKGCITHPDHQESVSPIMVRSGDNVRCHYCDSVMSTIQLR